jgi:hypothetical protein
MLQPDSDLHQNPLLRHELFNRARHETPIGVGSRLRSSICGFPSVSELVHQLIKAIDPGFPKLARWDQQNTIRSPGGCGRSGCRIAPQADGLVEAQHDGYGKVGPFAVCGNDSNT